MALIDTDVRRTFATGIAGFSHVVDSLSAIRYAKVKVIRDEYGIARKFETEGDFPRYGNDDNRADEIAVWLLKTFLHKVKKYHTYRNSEATTSILTITSNVVYGKATGDFRTAGRHSPRLPRAQLLPTGSRAERSARLFKLRSQSFHMNMRSTASPTQKRLHRGARSLRDRTEKQPGSRPGRIF